MSNRLFSQCLVVALIGSVTVGTAQSQTAQPEPAPPPREKLTPADQIIGRWKLVKYGGREMPEWSKTVEVFTKDGKYTAITSVRGRADEIVAGTYRFEGKEIEIRVDPPRPGPAVRYQIVKLTLADRVIQHGEREDYKRSEWIRLEGK